MTSIISGGTVTVTNGSVTVTGMGTAFATAAVENGLLLVGGTAAFVASVESDTSLTLTKAWAGSTAADTDYEIQRTNAAAASAVDANDRLAEIARRVQAGSFLQPTALGTLAGRSAYDNAAEGTIYVVPASSEGGSPTVYIKNSDTNADWSAGQSFQGPKGDAGNPLATTTAFAESLLDDSDAATMRATLLLGNVDNTTDANKPVSTAQQAAIDAKLPLTAGGLRNKIVNPLFAVNQRAFGGGGLAAGAYGHDRWGATTGGCSYTVSSDTATIASGTVRQVIEGAAIEETGSYVLNWNGTATAKINGAVVAKGSTVNLNAGANVNLDFSGGTFSKPQLERGTIATPFEHRVLLEEVLCQRYFFASGHQSFRATPHSNAFPMRQTASFAQPMRTTPAIAITLSQIASVNVSSIVVYNNNNLSVSFEASAATSAMWYNPTYTIKFTADAELSLT